MGVDGRAIGYTKSLWNLCEEIADTQPAACRVKRVGKYLASLAM
jgi:hypothetical protein